MNRRIVALWRAWCECYRRWWNGLRAALLNLAAAVYVLIYVIRFGWSWVVVALLFQVEYELMRRNRR